MYRQRPYLDIKSDIKIFSGYDEVFSLVSDETLNKSYISLETYPGTDKKKWIEWFTINFPKWNIVDTDIFFINEKEINKIINYDLTNDPEFGRISKISYQDFVDEKKVNTYQYKPRTIFIGVLAGIIFNADLKLYLDATKQRIKSNYINGLNNWKYEGESNSALKLKRAYYFEWPAADLIKINNLKTFDYYITEDLDDNPKLVNIKDLRKILYEFSSRPFRLVPYLAPGVWGGQWLIKKFNLDYDEVNLAWIFDGVLEENSIIAKKANIEMEIPGTTLLFFNPIELLGEKVFGRYGADFPIRFNYLDTVDGENLSLQVHPTLDYAYRNFGLKYTQDESYYIFHAEKDSCVFLGMKEGITKEELVDALEEAKKTNVFDNDKYINKFNVKTHDHILIPAGTIHSSGANTVVLEISTTQNRFTFKLWDWNRVDLNGKPRPISLEHGKNVINEKMTYDIVTKELINDFNTIIQDEYAIEERTGLHKLEDIETRRITLYKEYYQTTNDSVNVLNLVEGEKAIVTSPNNDFDDFIVYYGETFIIPESIKEYILRPVDVNKKTIFVKAYIR
ncbi:MAG: class I mannose-6-phosphate isomerase [Helcococcus sp.]|nr:class I mannose-6-phosphate isomerase [Helcococcus sp.]